MSLCKFRRCGCAEDSVRHRCSAYCNKKNCNGQKTLRCHKFVGPIATSDDINAPEHYRGTNGLEALDVIEQFELNFRLGACVKYILRHMKKGKPLHDLKKARFFLDREIAKREKAEEQ